jgi:Na+-translocating ferredoxin:NAD+ oxidoreductase RnfG subunit
VRKAKMYKRLILTILTILLGVQNLYAAVGCTLNDPDRDIKRLFPKATNYKTEFITIKERGGKELAEEVEAKLKDKLEPTHESLDVPYAYYTVLREKEVIGYVHGVNQKGMYGGMQLILATDPNGMIIDFYYQKITSPESKKFNDKKFTGQFVGLTLADFYTKDLKKSIKDPSKDSAEDYLATLRGIKKNLILHDEFKLKNKYDKFFYSKKKENKDEKQKDNQ